MYVIYNQNLNAYYGTGGMWLPRKNAKHNIGSLIFFDDIYDAKATMNHEKFTKGVQIINEKTLKNHLKIQELSDAQETQDNCVHTGKTSEPTKQVVSSSSDSSSIPDVLDEPDIVYEEYTKNPLPKISNGSNQVTYCEYLDSIQNCRSAPKADTVYLKGDNTDILMDTPLILDSIRQVKEVQALMQRWTNRMNEVDEEIRECDLRISDELHFLELLSGLSDEEMLNSAKRLQEIRRNRRIAKNEKAVGTMFLQVLQTGVSSDKLQYFESYISSQKERTYKIRRPN